MTPIILLERLAEFVEENISDIKLQVRVTNTKPGEEKERAAEVHKMRLKKKEDKTQRIPYVLLQLLKLEDDKQPSQPAGATAKVRLVVATFSEDGEQGAYHVLTAL